MNWPFAPRNLRISKDGWHATRQYWSIERGWTWWPLWGFTVFVEVVFRDRIGLKLRLGPVLVWWWATCAVERIRLYPNTHTGTPTAFGVPLTSPPSGSSLTS